MISPRTFLATSLVVGLAVAAPATANRPQDAKDQTAETDRRVCNDEGDAIVFVGDKLMWPPNHKYQDFSVTADNADDGQTALEVAVTHDEYTEDGQEEVGSGNTDDDAREAAQADANSAGDVTLENGARSERSGRGDGRTYTVTAIAEFDGQEPCEETFEIEVPHDMRSDKAPAKDDKTGTTGPNQG